MRSLDPADTVARARQGDRRALARLVTAVAERQEPSGEIGRLLAPHSGRAHVVGITGAPGVGKSTTTAALIQAWRDGGRTVAVIAVDPSSPFTGGALLGDRIRMAQHSTDTGVFIRSMAARGRLGGLAAGTPAAVRVLDACGFDIVVIETVGVGQSEVDVVRHADTVVILLAPGMGDRVQATKAGLLEIGDIFAVNKSDRPGASATSRDIRAMVSAKPSPPDSWRPPVLSIAATTGDGIAELVAAVDEHRAHGEKSGELGRRRHDRIRSEIVGLAVEHFATTVESRRAFLQGLADHVLVGDMDPEQAARAAVSDAVNRIDV